MYVAVALTASLEQAISQKCGETSSSYYEVEAYPLWPADSRAKPQPDVLHPTVDIHTVRDCPAWPAWLKRKREAESEANAEMAGRSGVGEGMLKWTLKQNYGEMQGRPNGEERNTRTLCTPTLINRECDQTPSGTKLSG